MAGQVDNFELLNWEDLGGVAGMNEKARQQRR